MSRLENSAKNIVFSFGNTILVSILGFISRTVFIHILGTDYLGLAGLLGNVLGFLSISELGIATAIGFSLYKPLAEKDYKVVSSLMSLYRKAYSIIGTIVLISGILLFFFLDFFIPVDQQPAGTDFAYFAFLANTVVSYFLAYKTTLISSDNQAFRLVPINMAVNTAQTILQILVLVLTRNYVVYLSVQIVCSIILMALQNIYITQKYSEVDFSSKDRLPSEKTVEIKRNVSGLIIAKIGDYLVNSTDNLIITKLVSLAATGIYSNYLLIRNMINGFIATLFSGITASMGNVVAVENDEKKLEIFDTVFFCAFLIYSIEATCFMSLYNLFIGDIWIGRNYIFSAGTVAVIVLNNYLTGLRIPLITMKGAAGKYLEDTWIPFGFAIVNLVASILLAAQCQRLVAARCPHTDAGKEPCLLCHDSGEYGQLIVEECWTPDDEDRALMRSGADGARLRRASLTKGFCTMEEDGLKKVAQGQLSPQGLARAFGPEVLHENLQI